MALSLVYLTIGDYEREPKEMYATGNKLISHRISGSFHWQLKLNKIGFGVNTFAPTIRTAFMDTGSTLILMPKEDWVSLYNMICADLPYGSTCYTTDYYYVLLHENREKIKES